MMFNDPRMRWVLGVAAVVAALAAMMSQPKSQTLPVPAITLDR
jgi:hypothetical protein